MYTWSFDGNQWQSVSPVHAYTEYLLDVMQRSLLFWETIHARGNIYLEHSAQGKPPVLAFPYEILIDGRSLDEPCNYLLLRIVPQADHTADPDKRPFIIVDPRAGHGPGIGGFKQDSQVGIAMRARHPVYFISFLPEPEIGQTLTHVARAEKVFIEEVRRRHPNADRPCVIGNCQAGWAVAALAAAVPDLMGPILLNGAPLSYWAGVDGKNPMRYSGGLLGGTWLASLASDLGNGKFDGAHLVANFENLNPANTWWDKHYNLYANIDSERSRYLEFERWWSGFFVMNREEMEDIVSLLFIGNRLSQGIDAGDGVVIDLQNIVSPIVVFASEGDNITPPQQALNWLIDVYGHEDAIIAKGQVIVYLIHQSIGHLGIFVSSSVARKEHTELFDTLDMIDGLVPGLYEMIIEPKVVDMPLSHLVPGDYVVRLEKRSIEDIRSLDDGREEEALFEPMAAVSEINERFYKLFFRPWVQAMCTEASALALREMHPLRIQRSMFSDLNPAMQLLPKMAHWVKQIRRPADDHNFFVQLEKMNARAISDTLDMYRDVRDTWCTHVFKFVYGPLGFGAWFPPQNRIARARDSIRKEWAHKHHDLLDQMAKGGMLEAVARICMAVINAQGRIERRTRLMAKAMGEEDFRTRHLSDKERRAVVRRQAELLWMDRQRALDSLRDLLPSEAERHEALAMADKILAAQNSGTTARAILSEIEAVLELSHEENIDIQG